MTCWIFANGELTNPDALRPLFRRWDTFYAVDGGLKYLKVLGIVPHLVIGDLDSANPQDLEWAQDHGAVFHRYSLKKDETDLEEAIFTAAAAGHCVIRIAGAGGGRIDHALGNLFLLQNPNWDGLDLRFEDGIMEIYLTRASATIDGQPGDIVSLLPLGGNAEEVATSNLQYPLRSETLYAYGTRGISNVMVAQEATVTLAKGTLIVVHLRSLESLYLLEGDSL
ncbi:MAG TPA: thiamine diphosphokinase [Longilinea sp.]|nr:thiamine diphosphokinase [Longilinea sp.]